MLRVDKMNLRLDRTIYAIDASQGYFHFTRGPFTNYVTHFWLFFDHPSTYGYVLALNLLINYFSKAFNSYTFADHLPTPTA